jgi:hypothetical protein
MEMKRNLLLLLVPLAWPTFGIAGSAPQQPSAGLVWQQSERTNAEDAFNFSRFTSVGKFITPLHDIVPNRPALVVDCIPAKVSSRGRGTFLAGNLLVGTTLKIVYVEPEIIRGINYFPMVAVRYHTDNAKDEQQKWSPGSDKTSASIDKDSLKKILRARTFAITADDNRGSQVTMQFDMPDPTLVEEACHVDEHKR